MTRKIGVAVVGLGIGRDHIMEAYARHTDKFDLVAICDTNPALLNAIGDEFGVRRRTESFADLLSMAGVDVIDICSPPFTHFGMIRDALAAGKSAICEKPLVGSMYEVDEIIRLEREAAGHVMPIFQMRWGTGMSQARALIQSGIIGRPQVGTIETMWDRPPEYYEVSWRAKWKTELGGVLTSQAIHAHDLLTFLMGPIQSVFARTDTRLYDMEIEDTLSATVLMASGAPVSLTATNASAGEITRIRLVYEHVTMESDHSPYNPGGAPWTFTCRKPEIADQVDAIIRSVGTVEHTFSGQMLAYHAALMNGTELPMTLADARRSIELASALHYSSRTATEVVLPLGKQHPYYRSWAQ